MPDDRDPVREFLSTRIQQGWSPGAVWRVEGPTGVVSRGAAGRAAIEPRVEPLLAWSLFVRRLLTTYTILCVGYLYVREASTWNLPELGGKPFPWM